MTFTALKAGRLEVADILIVNKADCPGADALALDMESISRESGGKEKVRAKVCMTVASEGKRIDSLKDYMRLCFVFHEEDTIEEGILRLKESFQRNF